VINGLVSNAVRSLEPAAPSASASAICAEASSPMRGSKIFKGGRR